VTGRGYDVSDVVLGGEVSWGSQSLINTNQDYGLVVEEFAMNNAWHIKASPVRFLPPDATIQVFAECLKLVPRSNNLAGCIDNLLLRKRD
jgi:hypothetical protein